VLFSVSHPISARVARKLRRRTPADPAIDGEHIVADAARVPSTV